MKIKKSPLWIKVATFFAIAILPGVDCNAGTLGKPVKQINLRDVLRAAVAVALCKPENEFPDIVKVELVAVEVYGKTKMIYKEVNKKNTTEVE